MPAQDSLGDQLHEEHELTSPSASGNLTKVQPWETDKQREKDTIPVSSPSHLPEQTHVTWWESGLSVFGEGVFALFCIVVSGWVANFQMILQRWMASSILENATFTKREEIAVLIIWGVVMDLFVACFATAMYMLGLWAPFAVAAVMTFAVVVLMGDVIDDRLRESMPPVLVHVKLDGTNVMVPPMWILLAPFLLILKGFMALFCAASLVPYPYDVEVDQMLEDQLTRV
jgi:hypothetical protein